MSDAPQTMSLQEGIAALAQRRSEESQAAVSAPEEQPKAPQQEASSVVEEPQQAAEDAQSEETLDDGQPDEYQELSEEEDGETVEEYEGDEDADEEPIYTVKVDGEEIEVTLEEALAGHMRERAFTKKTMEVAEKRKAVEAQQAQVAQQGEANLAILSAVVEGLAGNPVPAPDPNLFHTDREAYDRAKHEHETWVNQYGQWQTALQQVGQQHLAQKQTQLQELASQELPKIQKAFGLKPGDVAGFNNKRSELLNMVVSEYGIPAEDVSNVVQSGFFLMAEDARKWRELQSGSSAKATQKMKRKGIQPIRGGRANTKPKKVSQSEVAKQRFEQTAKAAQAGTGRLDDAFGAAAAALSARRAERGR